MRLEKVFITRDQYGQTKGQLRGEIEFSSEHGKVQLSLDETTSHNIVRECAEAIMRSSRQVAEDMTAEVIEASLQIERK